MTTPEISLKFFKTIPWAMIPKYATEGSACFDFVYPGVVSYQGYDSMNSKFDRDVSGTLILMPNDRVMVPTGLIADIPNNYSIRIHPRSGLSLKSGVVLANQEAVIDSDYTQEIFILLHNISFQKVKIEPGDRIAQGELVYSPQYEIVEIKKEPKAKTSRKGGMGSTGK